MREGAGSREPGATGLDNRASAPDCLPETQQMPMDAERPSPDPRPTTRHQTTPRPADSFVQSAERAPNELAICCSGGGRVFRAGRGAEIAPDRSASSATLEVSRKPAGLPTSPDGIDWRQRPGTGRLRRIRSTRPARSTRHHRMLEAFYRLEILAWYCAIVIARPVAELSS